MLISFQHQELQNKYNQALMRMHQHEEIVKKKDQQNAHLSGEITTLKNSFDHLKELFVKQQQQIETLLKDNAEDKKQLAKLQLIEHQYEQLKKLMYGRSSEKSHPVLPGQLSLGLEAELVEACSIHDGQKVSSYTKYKPKNENHPGRNELPAHIPKVYVDIHPTNLPEGAEEYGSEDTEQLEYDPAKLFATVYRRHKYKRMGPDGVLEFYIGELPKEKDKSLAAPSLKAHCTVEKFLWHTPINRQINKFAQDGIIISDTTMGDWINGTCRSLTALYEEHRKGIIYSASRYMMADETGITVLDTEKKGRGKKSHIGYFWSYCNPVDKLVFFEYQRGRGNKHAKPVLENFKGTLHTDGYNVCAT